MLADDQPACGFQDASQLSKHGRRIRHLSQGVDQIRAIEARRRVWKVLNVTDCRNDIDHARFGGSPGQPIEHLLLDVEDVEPPLRREHCGDGDSVDADAGPELEDPLAGARLEQLLQRSGRQKTARPE